MNRAKAKRKLLKLDRALMRAYVLGAVPSMRNDDDSWNRMYGRLRRGPSEAWGSRPPWTVTGI